MPIISLWIFRSKSCVFCYRKIWNPWLLRFRVLCFEFWKCFYFMYQIKPSRFVNFSVCYDIAYKILELEDERINIKNSGIEICSWCRIWADCVVIGLSNFWIPKQQVQIFLWTWLLRKFNFKHLFRNRIFSHLYLLNGEKCVLIFVLVSALWRIYLIHSFPKKICRMRNVDL